jgi:hypothetical protein
MTEKLPNSFIYEHCDVPDGVSLNEWRTTRPQSQRKAQMTGGFLAAITTLAPLALSLRGSRK